MTTSEVTFAWACGCGATGLNPATLADHVAACGGGRPIKLTTSACASPPAAPGPRDSTLGTLKEGAMMMKCPDCGGLVNMYDGDTLLHGSGGCKKAAALEPAAGRAGMTAEERAVAALKEWRVGPRIGEDLDVIVAEAITAAVREAEEHVRAESNRQFVEDGAIKLELREEVERLEAEVARLSSAQAAQGVVPMRDALACAMIARGAYHDFSGSDLFRLVLRDADAMLAARGAAGGAK